MERLQYIAVEGPIGVGKSSLAKKLAHDLNGRLILEEPEKNPFLAEFYQKPELFAFQTQIFFLLSRYRQQKELKQQELFNQITICDYLFAKDKIFASMNLSTEETDLYNDVYHLLDARLPKPDMVVFLQASPQVLMDRVRKRNSEWEEDLNFEYIEELSKAYTQFFFQFEECPVLVVNASHLDFVNNESDYDTLIKEMKEMWRKGVKKHYLTIDHS